MITDNGLERVLAALPERMGLGTSPGLRFGIELATRALADGAPCIDLAAYAGTPLSASSPATYPTLGAWRAELLGNGFVGEPGEFKPLILDGSRLYFARYFMYERDVAQALRVRAATEIEAADAARLEAHLDALFARNAGQGAADHQRQAAFVAATRGLCVISGGPGTGKTSTVLRLLVALQAAQPEGQPLTIRLAAPTGKAAARMTDAIKRAKDEVRQEPACATLVPALASVPEDASTLHRLLGAVPGSVRTRFNARHPLHADVLVIDEASMIDLAMMARVLGALPPHARLVLLGDKDQLESVEAGRVFADLTATTPRSALEPSVVRLTRSHRFSADSAIGRLAHAVNAGDAEAAIAILNEGDDGVVAHFGAVSATDGALEQAVLDGYEAYVRLLADDAVDLGDDARRQDLFAAFERFRVLSPLREGPTGVVGLNARIERALAGRLGRNAAGRARVVPGRNWIGQPLIVTRNDHARRLYNGDIGLVVPAGGALKAAFPGDGGALRLFAPSVLPEPETVCAMTVHKSQGSEFDRVLLVLPSEPNPVLTRSLVYTAITRARRVVEIRGPEDVLRAAIANADVRTGGLAERLAI